MYRLISAFAAVLSVTSVASAAPYQTDKELNPDIRFWCTEGGRIAVDRGKAPKTEARVIDIKADKQRMARLSGGEMIISRPAGLFDELLVQEQGGKYRRIMRTQGEIVALLESPVSRQLAAVLQVETDPKVNRPAVADLYVIDVATWEGRKVAERVGYRTMAWDAAGKRLAVSDFARLRVLDVSAEGKEVEFCGVDSGTTNDMREWLTDVSWIGDGTLHFVYTYPVKNVPFKVTLP